jgi:5'(3')-deoxyribonucleotidase
MRIGVDLDEVLAQAVPNVIMWHNKYYGTNHDVMDKPPSYGMFNIWGGSPKEAKDKILIWCNSPEISNADIVFGAVAGINGLKINNDLIVITARPKSADARTEAWLNKHFPNIFKSIIHNEDWNGSGVFGPKVSACKRAQIDVLIDDSIETARNCAAAGIPVLLFDYPWNQSDDLPENVTRVKTWEEIVAIINSQLI